MGTNSGTILPFSHQINDIEQNRLRIGSKFSLGGVAVTIATDVITNLITELLKKKLLKAPPPAPPAIEIVVIEHTPGTRLLVVKTPES